MECLKQYILSSRSGLIHLSTALHSALKSMFIKTIFFSLVELILSIYYYLDIWIDAKYVIHNTKTKIICYFSGFLYPENPSNA